MAPVASTPSSSTRSSTRTGTERGALLGALGRDGRSADRPVANYVRLRDPSVAEAAFAVADDLQGAGIGTRLLEQPGRTAPPVGIERFVAEVLPDNRAMLGVSRPSASS